MALTLDIQLKLDAAGLIEFFEADEGPWRDMAQKAFTYTREGFPVQAEVRPDDLAKTLKPFVEVDEGFRDELAEKKLRQKYWVDWFTALIIDRCWEELEDPEDDQETDDADD